MKSRFRFFKWTQLPVGVGIGLICYQKYRHIREGDGRLPQPWPQWKVTAFSSLPLRTSSRWFGKMAELPLPRFMRRPVIGLYVWTYSCNVDEALESDITAYSSLAEFFRRRLKPDARPISRSELVIPTDSTVLHRGVVGVNGDIQHVKGQPFTVDELLGETPKEQQSDRCLFYCTLYLAPGDYHGFHSPAEWSVEKWSHFGGLLLSVRHHLLQKIPKLFCMNERVCLMGAWRHGFFSMTAVGATNVGNIVIDEDDCLMTNQSEQTIENRQFPIPIVRKPGDRIGEFRMGSSIVLIFEAPKRFRFCVNPADKVRLGQSLGFVVPDDVKL